MKHKVRHIHFVGIGGSGMSGIAEVLANLGYQVSGSDLAENAATRRLAQPGREDLLRHTPRERQRRRRGGGVLGGAGRQPRGGRGARAAHPGGAARADARRADAPEAGRRDRRHARQDHHHQPGGERARRGRARPDLRHRRAAQRRRLQRAPRRGRLHRGRGRRVRRLVPAPAAGDRGGHQHRRRPHGHLPAGLRAAEAGVRAVPAEPAVLRRARCCAPTTRTCARSCRRSPSRC